MYVKWQGIDTPADDTIIWRYMDFAKFVAMLEAKALYFSSLLKLNDPYEGSFPTSHWEAFAASLATKKDHPAYIIPGILDRQKRLGRLMRAMSYVNCWHANAGESAAMWDIYQKSGEGIAVRSTLEKLRESLSPTDPERIAIGLVKYVDYQKDALPFGDLTAPAFHKRQSFAHEEELRAWFCDLNLINKRRSRRGRYRPGHNISVGLDKLIEQVYVAPTAPGWLATLTEAVLKRYGLDKPVKKSDLATEPVW
jgi:hypothetical protein